MLKQDADKARKALKEYDDLVVAHGQLVGIRDGIKAAGARRLVVSVEGESLGQDQRVHLRNAIQDELFDWLTEKYKVDIAANVRAQERISLAAIEDLHAKNGK